MDLTNSAYFKYIQIHNLLAYYKYIMLQDVEAVGKKKGFTIEKKNFHNISLGQGQEQVAEDAIELGSRLGYWVMLQVNIKLQLIFKSL